MPVTAQVAMPPMIARMMKAGILAIAHFTMNVTIEKKGMSMSVTTTRPEWTWLLFMIPASLHIARAWPAIAGSHLLACPVA